MVLFSTVKHISILLQQQGQILGHQILKRPFKPKLRSPPHKASYFLQALSPPPIMINIQMWSQWMAGEMLKCKMDPPVPLSVDHSHHSISPMLEEIKNKPFEDNHLKTGLSEFKKSNKYFSCLMLRYRQSSNSCEKFLTSSEFSICKLSFWVQWDLSHVQVTLRTQVFTRLGLKSLAITCITLTMISMATKGMGNRISWTMTDLPHLVCFSWPWDCTS